MRNCTLTFLTLALLSGCGGGSGGKSPSTPQPDKVVTNRAPQAKIKAEASPPYNNGQILKFDGSTSTDADNDALTYSWQLTNSQQQNIALNNATAQKVEFSLQDAGNYTLSLQVHDGKVQSDKATTSFELKAVPPVQKPPVAVAGPDLRVKVMQLVQLSAEQSSAEQGELTTLQWHLVKKPAASQAILQHANEIRPWFSPDVAGQYQAELTVTNTAGLQARQSVNITASLATTDLPPQAEIKTLVSTIAPDFALQLSASGSQDDSAGLKYQWQISQSPAGSQHQLSETDQPIARFSAKTAGDYQLSLVLTDAAGQQSRQQQSITVRSSDLPPVVRLSAPEQAGIAQTIVLDAADSVDPLQLPLQYRWQLLAKPKASQVQLQDASSSKASLRPDVTGQYLVLLQVSNGRQQTEVRRVIEVASLPTVLIKGPQQAAVQQTLTLLGQASAVNQPLSYQWSVLRSPVSVNLTASTGSQLDWRPTATGRYQLQLQVTDSEQRTQAARWDLQVTDNLPPEIILAGPAEQTGVPGALFSFDASQSRDPENGRLSFSWLMTKPAGSKAVLLQPDSATPNFTADVAGDYLLTLTLTDDAGNSSKAERKVRITEPTQTISGTVSGRLLDPDNQPLANDVTILINGSQTTADSNGYFSKVIQQRSGEAVEVKVRQQKSALLTYTSPVQTKDNFELMLGNQRLVPELPLEMLTIQGCAFYRGPERFNLRFTLNALPAGSIFSSDYTVTVPVDLTKTGLTTLLLPSGAGYRVAVTDADVLLDHSFGSGGFATSQQYQHPFMPLGTILNTFTFCHR
ncbi:PKD domain-containing protein [Rheinheimera texasensis]|uniref:PKD domain-containing protein n=1 Tax=Rheinheimera texasensis TaxID=306205 RepID=UPI0004E0C02D|nr:PKD domain-containing protein [Rheinheimera texasensis]